MKSDIRIVMIQAHGNFQKSSKKFSGTDVVERYRPIRNIFIKFSRRFTIQMLVKRATV